MDLSDLDFIITLLRATGTNMSECIWAVFVAAPQFFKEKGIGVLGQLSLLKTKA